MSMEALSASKNTSSRDELSIICSFHSCQFNYIQLGLQKSLENRCETCWRLYGEKPLRVASFSYPFYNSKDVEYDIIIMPARDRSFSNSITNLHIAVAHRFGLVLDFDKKGLDHKIKEGDGYDHCLRLHLIESLNLQATKGSSMEKCWHETVTKYLCEPERKRWSSSSYHMDTNNCFDFVLHFVESLTQSCASDAIDFKSKDSFCNNLIKTRIQNAALYLSLREYIVDDDEMVFVGKDKLMRLISCSGREPINSGGSELPLSKQSKAAA